MEQRISHSFYRVIFSFLQNIEEERIMNTCSSSNHLQACFENKYFKMKREVFGGVLWNFCSYFRQRPMFSIILFVLHPGYDHKQSSPYFVLSVVRYRTRILIVEICEGGVILSILTHGSVLISISIWFDFYSTIWNFFFFLQWCNTHYINVVKQKQQDDGYSRRKFISKINLNFQMWKF